MGGGSGLAKKERWGGRWIDRWDFSSSKKREGLGLEKEIGRKIQPRWEGLDQKGKMGRESMIDRWGFGPSKTKIGLGYKRKRRGRETGVAEGRQPGQKDREGEHGLTSGAPAQRKEGGVGLEKKHNE